MSLSSSTAQSPTFTAPTQLLTNASLVFSLTVSDGVNTSTADTVTITVTAGVNDAPTADAGTNQTVAEGATVTLDGSGSSGSGESGSDLRLEPDLGNDGVSQLLHGAESDFHGSHGTAVQRLAGVLSHRLRRSEHLHRRHGDHNRDRRSERRAHGRRRFGPDGGGSGYGHARRKRQRRSRERGPDLLLEPDLGVDGVSEFLHGAESDFHGSDGTAVQRVAGVLPHRFRRSEHLHRRHGDHNRDRRSQRRAHGRRRFGRDGGGGSCRHARRKRQRRSGERGSDLRLEPDLGVDGEPEFLHGAESDFHRSRRNCCPTRRWCSLSPSPTE